MGSRELQTSAWRAGWKEYLLAVVSTSAALGVRLEWAAWFGDRPVLILFLVPIILSAYVGGLGPGLLSTALAAVSINYLLIPPSHSLVIARPVDFVQWLILLLTGVLVSLLSERLHRFRRQAEKLASEAQHAEAIVRNNEAKFRQLAESLPQLVWTTSPDGSCDYLSPQWIAFTGVPLEAQLGAGWLNQVHPDDRQRIHDTWQVAHDAETLFHVEYRIRHHDGSYHWFDTRAVPLRNAEGRIAKWFGSTTDNEERRQAEQLLRESETRFRTVVETGPDAIFIQTKGCFAYVNPMALKLFGATDEHQLLGQSVIEHFHLECRHNVRERIKRLNEEHLPAPLLNEKLLRCDGTALEVEVSAVPFAYQGENGALVFARDISARIQAETERKKLQDQLFQAQKMEALGRLSGGIAHDFNNLLTAIAGNTRIALEDLAALHPLREHVLEIENATTRARDLVRRILTFSRQEESIRKPVELHSVVTEAIKLLRSTLPAMIEIRTNFPPNLPRVSADATQIHQVIMNLGTNAAHAMEKQGGLLQLSLDTITIDANQAKLSPDLYEGNFVRLTVSDNGCGIPKATAERIFEPFFTTKGIGEGTGLGLSVVHGIMKNHQGAITVYSQPGQGTVFRLYFPSTSAPTEKAVHKTHPLTVGKGERILYLDDEKALVFVATRILDRLGYKVTGFTVPTEALEAFRTQPDGFDAIISDCSMPGMTGFEFAKAVLALRPHCPIILTSGYVRRQDISEAETMGIRHFISKPNTIEDLENALHEIFSNTKPERPAVTHAPD